MKEKEAMAIYHLHVKTGSRSGGQSAAAKSDYVQREGKYGKGREEVQEVGHGNMPEWAEGNPHQYWQAADEHERANGRLFTEVEFALPLELTPEEQAALVREFAEHLTQSENLPYTYAIHKGEYDHQGRKTDTPENPHCHLVISERINDGIERSAETWFKRANKKAPDKGGAVKSEILKTREWLCQTREQWQEFANAALERSGHDARIDHRTLEAQGITDRLPQIHKGAAGRMAARGIETERHHQAIEIMAINGQWEAVQHEQARIDVEIERAQKQKIQSAAETLAKTEPLNLLEIHCEIALRELNDSEAALRSRSSEQEKLIERARSQVETDTDLKEQLADLQSGFLGNFRHRKKIAELEQTRRKNFSNNRKDTDRIAELGEISDALKNRIEGLKGEVLTYGKALHLAAAESREKTLSGLPDEAKALWARLERRIRTSDGFNRLTAIQQHRQLKTNFLNITRAEYWQKHGQKQQESQRGASISRGQNKPPRQNQDRDGWSR